MEMRSLIGGLQGWTGLFSTCSRLTAIPKAHEISAGHQPQRAISTLSGSTDETHSLAQNLNHHQAIVHNPLNSTERMARLIAATCNSTGRRVRQMRRTGPSAESCC